VFCAGGDRSEIGARPQVASNRLLDALLDIELFVVARIEAPVLGAGVALVRSCPVALGTPAATFTLPEAAMGNYPVPAASLAGVLPARRVVEVAALGAPVGSDEAAAAGLLTRVVAPEEIDDLVALWAERMTAQPAVAHQARRVWQRDLAAAREAAAWQEDMVRQDIATAVEAIAPAEVAEAEAAANGEAVG
jgi:enoyl-CoA hydratase/carnithine racemase